MSARKQYGGGFAVLQCLVVATLALGLSGCGSDKVPTTPTSTPTPPPAAVTRVVSQGNDSLESGFLGWVVFTTTTAGTLGVEVNWTFTTNDVDIFLARGNDPCTDETFGNGTCPFIATEESSSMKPEKLSVPNLAAGTYTLYIANFGDTDESVAWQATLTSTSASSVSSATTASVRRGAAKKSLNRIIELR